MSKLVQSFKDLDVYRGAFKLQQKLFAASKRWPDTEKFALTDQIRRSSRSIGANIAEAWAKRRYPAHFLSKLTDSDGELQETVHWLESAFACQYLTQIEHGDLIAEALRIGKQLGSMINEYESFCPDH